MKKYLLLFATVFGLFSGGVRADEYEDAIAYRDALREEIAAVDSEIQRCEKTLKGWKAATIIGGIGTAATGVGLLLQNKQKGKNENILSANKSMLKKQEEENALDKKIKQMAAKE